MKKNPSKAAINKDPLKDLPKVEEKPKEPEVEQSGYGRFQYKNGTLYVGNWKLINGVKMKHGFGKITHAGTTSHEFGQEDYEGDWAEDLMNGHGVYKYTSGAVYSGMWKNGKHSGLGTYQLPDGSKYEGEWEDHKMNGDGVYLDHDGRIWEGIFVEGVYETKNQKKLQSEKEVKIKLKTLEEESKHFFQKFFDVYSKSDKKTFKDNLTPFFGNGENIGEYIGEPYVKYEERGPEKWNEAFHAFNDDGIFSVHALSKRNDSKFIEVDRIKWDQIIGKDLEFGGQIVEMTKKIGESREMIICLVQKNDKNWVVIYFKDIINK